MSPQSQHIIKEMNKFDASPYGQQFTGLLEMRLMQGAKVGEVLEYIQELLDSLRKDQLADDIAHGQQMASYESTINQLEESLSKLSTELQKTNEFIAVVSEEIIVLTQTIVTLERQLALLNQQEQRIRDARAADIKAYNRRVISAEKVINALNLIIQKLGDAVDQQDAQATQAVLAQISTELGPKHPITILIKMTAKFDSAVVRGILEKLVVIRDAAMVSLNDDKANEVIAAERFETGVAEVVQLIKRLSDDYNSSKSILQTKTEERVFAVATRDQLNIDIPMTQALLEATKAAAEQYHADYMERTSRRSGEIAVVEQAYNLIYDHVESIKKPEQLTAQLNG